MVDAADLHHVSSPAARSSRSYPFASLAVLVAILVAAAILRLVSLTHAPPGLHQDEAANAWNAYCLLKTGRDQVGVRWPVFSSRSLGSNRSTLYLYVLMPFQALGGISPLTTRLPAAIGGVITVILLYLVGSRMFCRQVGLVAAGFLSFNPWHIQMSRWGHEASLVPLLILIILALWSWANLPLGDSERGSSRVWGAAVTGLAVGVSGYGYQAIRIFLPVFLIGTTLASWRAWGRLLKTRQGVAASMALAITIAATFGPLVWKHVTEPEVIAKRGQATWVWRGAETAGAKVLSVLGRYPGHFGIDFLFAHGDRYAVSSVPGIGQFHWYMAPLMIAGLVVVLRRVRSSAGARVLLIWVLLYPIADCFNSHISMHALRSSPGLCGLILLAALGAVYGGRGLFQAGRPGRTLAVALGVAVVVACNVNFAREFFVGYGRKRIVFQGFHTDLVAACQWLRPRLEEVDAVYITTNAMMLPYVVTLVALGHDPARWFEEPRIIHEIEGWDIYERYGKIRFLYGQWILDELEQLSTNGRRDRVLFIVRPGELGLGDPVQVISGPDGLWICELEI